MSSRWSNQIWVEHTKYQHRLNKLDVRPLMQTQLSSHWKIYVHRDHNTSFLHEVQLFTSTRSPNQLPLSILENPNKPNSFIRVTSPKGCAITAAYVPSAQGIKPHSNELHRAQPTLFFAATITPRFPKYAETELRRESATYIRKKNTSRIHAKPKVTWTNYKNLLW